jgi:hypothetical protein
VSGGPLGAWFKGGRSMGPSALVGVIALVAIEFALNGGQIGSGASDPTFQVRLERGMCLGSCPVYAVELDASGHVKFVGAKSEAEPSVACQGERRWQAAPAAVGRLEALIDRSGFFGFKSDYVAQITDMPPVVVTVTRHGRTKRVRDYVGRMVGMPVAMTQIEIAIDEAAATKACVVGEAAAP